MSGRPAARVTDSTACPLPGHGTNPIAEGSPDVVFDGLPAARQGDAAGCGGLIVSGVSSTVFINGQPAATLGSIGAHGNVVISGSGSVIIGDSHAPALFTAPAPLQFQQTYATSFSITDSESGEPLAYREFVALVDGRQQIGTTDANGIAHIKTPLENSVVSLHVKFKAPARILDEMVEG